MVGQKQYKYSGVTLLEMMLVLVVIVIITLSATRYYTTARDEARITQAVTIINNIANAAYKWAEGRPNFGYLSIAALTDAQLLPSNYNPGTAVNPWKGKINVWSRSASAKRPDMFDIELTNVPYKLCKNLIQKMSNVSIIKGQFTHSCTDDNAAHVLFSE